MKNIAYSSYEEYISNQLHRINYSIDLAIRFKGSEAPQHNVIPGISYSLDGIIQLLEKLNKNVAECHGSSDTDKQFLQSFKEKQKERKYLINSRLKASPNEGKDFPLEILKNILHITTDFEIDMLLLCLAPYVDARYEIIYGYIQDDLTKKYPTLQLIFDVLTEGIEQRLENERYCTSDSPLFRWKILKYGGTEPGSHSVSSLFRPLYIDESVVNFLLKTSHNIFPYREFLPGLNFRKTDDPYVNKLDDLYVSTAIKQNLKNLLRYLQKNEKGTYYFYGPYGSGKVNSAIALAKELKKHVIEVDMKALVHDEHNFSENILRVIREALLLDTSVLINHFDCILSDDEKSTFFRDLFIQEIDSQPVLIFLTGEKVWNRAPGVLSLTFPVLTHDLRKEVWNKVVDEFTEIPISIDPDEMASKFRFTEGQIRDAVLAAKSMTAFYPSEGQSITQEDIITASRMQCHHKLSELSLKLEPRFTWCDIVLPKDQMSQLQEVCDQFLYRDKIYDEWEFNKKTSRGKGLNVLFSGSPGTGKTMAAEVIANELKLEIYKIDLSQVVSKYIGETEKNLNRIFNEAESSNAILFFDEADALFGKRSEVKDAHDRYANIEISYLLQKMEEYEGMTILATNLRQNMDEAFVRRIQFIVDFPLPDKNHRYDIWKVHFPEKAPIGDNIDFEFLARQFQIAGGNIKNIVLNASFLAASGAGTIRMEHIIYATMREYQKMGRLCVKGEFGKYYELIEGRRER